MHQVDVAWNLPFVLVKKKKEKKKVIGKNGNNNKRIKRERERMMGTLSWGSCNKMIRKNFTV